MHRLVVHDRRGQRTQNELKASRKGEISPRKETMKRVSFNRAADFGLLCAAAAAGIVTSMWHRSDSPSYAALRPD